jgi:hypothetical protein
MDLDADPFLFEERKPRKAIIPHSEYLLFSYIPRVSPQELFHARCCLAVWTSGGI